MANVPTPHIKAKMGEIAEKILMPGDPLRAKFIAENYLSDAVCVNDTRNMLGFTGNYKGSKVTVMGSGMGVSSIGIYSYELFNFYEAETIIRIGTAGALVPQVQPRDVIIAQGACHDTNVDRQYGLPGTYAPIADFGLVKRAYELATEKNIKAHVGNVLTGEVLRWVEQPFGVVENGCSCRRNGSGGTLYECGGGRQEGTVHLHRYEQPSDRNGGHHTRRT